MQKFTGYSGEEVNTATCIVYVGFFMLTSPTENAKFDFRFLHNASSSSSVRVHMYSVFCCFLNLRLCDVQLAK